MVLMGAAAPLATPLQNPPLFELRGLEFLPQSSGQSSLSWLPTLNYKLSTFKFIDSPIHYCVDRNNNNKNNIIIIIIIVIIIIIIIIVIIIIIIIVIIIIIIIIIILR